MMGNSVFYNELYLLGSTATLSPIMNCSFAKSPRATIFPLNSWPRVMGEVVDVLNSPLYLTIISLLLTVSLSIKPKP